MFFIQTSTPPPSMHRKPIKCCMQSNQLQARTTIELKDNCVHMDWNHSDYKYMQERLKRQAHQHA